MFICQEFYDASPERAWYDGYCVKRHREIIGTEVYRVWRFYLPKILKKKIKEIRNWLIAFNKAEGKIPYDFRRRQTIEEYAELALTIFGRLEIAMRAKRTVAIGAQDISPVPWAIFGAGGKWFSRYQFCDINDIYDHYRNDLSGATCYGQDIHFVHMNGEYSKQLGVKYNMTANLVIALALLLFTDIIINCGPDCVELFDTYTNDYRNSYGSQAVANNWSGVHNNVHVHKVVEKSIYREERKSYCNTTVKIEESESPSDDLSAGEKTYCALLPPRKDSWFFFKNGVD